MIEHALAYAERGWPIFPCRANKSPYTKNGVNDATTDPATIEAWWEQWPNANIALNVGAAGMMAIDYDPGSSREELEKSVGPLPNTLLLSNTPRGGNHDFYDLDDGEVVAPSASKIAPHVDVRSFNSYVLLPPSKTKDGSYTWESEGKPAYRTDELLRAANSGREKHEDRDTWLIEPDLPENIASAIKWLTEEAKIAVEGQGGDHMAFATAAHMKSFGISEALAFDLIWEHWNPRCSPPWSADNIEHLQRKVENGYSYNSSPPGNVTPAYHTATTLALFKPVVTQLEKGKESTAGKFRFVDEDAMSEIKPPNWLIEDFLPEGAYAMMFGAPGTFKTFLALDMALSIAAGGATLGPDVCWPSTGDPGAVLYAAGEGRSDITKRVNAWQKRHHHSDQTGNFILADPVPLVSEQYQPFIDGAKAMHPEYKLVVLDTLGRSMAGLNENSQEHASAFTNLVEDLQYNLGAAVLVLHHTGLTEKHRGRGSSVFGADCDTIIRLDRHGKDKIVSMTMTKQKDAQEWERKKYVRMETVIVSTDPFVDSLVAAKLAEGERPKGDKFHPTADDTDANLEIVADVVLKLLKSDRSQDRSTSALADAVATDERVDISSSSLKQRHLILLREDNTQAVSQYYNADTGKWRYSD